MADSPRTYDGRKRRSKSVVIFPTHVITNSTKSRTADLGERGYSVSKLIEQGGRPRIITGCTSPGAEVARVVKVAREDKPFSL
jgi:hypothetical protein